MNIENDITRINFKAATNNLLHVLKSELTEMAKFNPPRFIQLQSAVNTINGSGLDYEDMNDEEYELTHVASLMHTLLGTVPKKLGSKQA